MTHESNLSKNLSFFDKWSKTYDSVLVQFWMKKFHKLVFNEIKLSNGIKIIDISCGTGELLKELNKKKSVGLYGIDFSEKMLQKARQKLSKNVELRQADVHNLPFQDNYFDYVISTEAFHHYHDQKKSISEIVRITKEEGKVIVVDMDFFFHFIHHLFEKLEPGCVKVNSKKEMLNLFKQINLADIKQQRNFFFSMMTVGTKSSYKNYSVKK